MAAQIGDQGARDPRVPDCADLCYRFHPRRFEAINSFIGIFKSSFNYSTLIRIQGFLDDALTVVRYAAFLVLAFLALKGKGAAIPGVDDAVQKHS